MEITNRISENTGDSWEEVDCEVGVCVCVWEHAGGKRLVLELKRSSISKDIDCIGRSMCYENNKCEGKIHQKIIIKRNSV